MFNFSQKQTCHGAETTVESRRTSCEHFCTAAARIWITLVWQIATLPQTQCSTLLHTLATIWLSLTCLIVTFWRADHFQVTNNCSLKGLLNIEKKEGGKNAVLVPNSKLYFLLVWVWTPKQECRKCRNTSAQIFPPEGLKTEHRKYESADKLKPCAFYYKR